jgi:hypothetical protein
MPIDKDSFVRMKENVRNGFIDLGRLCCFGTLKSSEIRFLIEEQDNCLENLFPDLGILGKKRLFIGTTEMVDSKEMKQKGIIVYPNGDVMMGRWKNNKLQGQPKIISKN